MHGQPNIKIRMSASVVSPYMFRSYTWPSSGDVPCTMLLSALLLCHNFTWVCGRIFYLCCCHVYLSAVCLVVYCFVHNKTDSRELYMTATQIGKLTKRVPYPSKSFKLTLLQYYSELSYFNSTINHSSALGYC